MPRNRISQPKESYLPNVGCKVEKDSGKPFKSGSKQNTVNGVIWNEKFNWAMYTFEDDDSQVECRRCKKVEID